MKSPLLSWFPCSPADWRRETGGADLARQGAMLLAAFAAWESKDVPCALPDDDRALSRLIGSPPKPVLAFVRDRFIPDSEVRGWLRWPWLWELYQQQLAAYERRSRAGHEGGKAKAGKQRSNATDHTGNASGNGTRNGSNATQKLEVVPFENRERGNARDAAVGRGGATAASDKTTDELRALMACDPDYAARVDALVSARIEREQIPPKFAPSARTVYLFEAMHEAYQQRQPELVA
jgi:hypothetical protein